MIPHPYENGIRIEDKVKDENENVFIGHRWVNKKKLLKISFLIVLCCFIYLFGINPPTRLNDMGLRTYSYQSIPLRFVKGTVQIKAKTGYIAYRGNVDRGRVEGQGTLYYPNGTILYQGNFHANAYSGEGELFYENGILQYEGTFLENQFSGNGTLYRRDGTLEYVGEFHLGQKNGRGTLYDVVGSKVFEGTFVMDQIVYSELLGTDCFEMSNYYQGASTVYTDKEHYAVYMEKMKALYYGEMDTDQSLQEVPVAGIIILSDELQIGNMHYTTFQQLEKYFETTGTVTTRNGDFATAISIHCINEKMQGAVNKIDFIEQKIDEELYEVDSFDEKYEVTVHSFEKEGIEYSFYQLGDGQTFFMYQMKESDS